MGVYSIGELAQGLPPFRTGEKNGERETFFQRIVEWNNYANDEYPFEDASEKILETLIQMKGEDKIECLIEVLSTAQFSEGTRVKAFKEAERVISKGHFNQNEKERLERKLSHAKKKKFETAILP